MAVATPTTSSQGAPVRPTIVGPRRVAAGVVDAVSEADRSAGGATTTVDPYSALIDTAVAGDPYALDELLWHLRPVVVRYCRGLFGRARATVTSPDDVAQDVCVAVLSALPSYRSSGASFLSFVYGIARNKVADAHRRNGRDKSSPVPDLPEAVLAVDGPEQHVLRRELSSHLSQLLGELTATQREVLTLRVLVGLTVAETADAVGSTPGAVRVTQHRAVQRLRAMVQGSRGSWASPYLAMAEGTDPARAAVRS